MQSLLKSRKFWLSIDALIAVLINAIATEDAGGKSAGKLSPRGG